MSTITTVARAFRNEWTDRAEAEASKLAEWRRSIEAADAQCGPVDRGIEVACEQIRLSGPLSYADTDRKSRRKHPMNKKPIPNQLSYEVVSFDRGVTHRAVVGGDLQRPHFNCRGAALAFASAVARGVRKPESATKGGAA
jgi:hypothetical protein